jgi:hypothetical protein
LLTSKAPHEPTGGAAKYPVQFRSASLAPLDRFGGLFFVKENIMPCGKGGYGKKGGMGKGKGGGKKK